MAVPYSCGHVRKRKRGLLPGRSTPTGKSHQVLDLLEPASFYFWVRVSAIYPIKERKLQEARKSHDYLVTFSLWSPELRKKGKRKEKRLLTRGIAGLNCPEGRANTRSCREELLSRGSKLSMIPPTCREELLPLGSDCSTLGHRKKGCNTNSDKIIWILRD